ncbi:MAG: class II aldolase/adducin family protein, partial [Mycobacterium sp.]
MLLEDVKKSVSKNEWDTRVALATAYRACFYLGYEQSTFGHLSARVPDEPNCMLLNPFGLGFDEITASSLVKVNSDRQIILENGYSLNEAAWNIHSGIMFNDDRINVIMHLHTLDGVAVSSQKNGFLPLCQDSVLFYDKIAYHDYEGIVIDPDEAPRLLQDLGDKRVLVLRNHGNIYVGPTMSEAFFYMFFFEKGCSIQVRALSA